MTGRTLAIGGTSYPLVLPNVRDPRLHVAAVIISIHVLGQLGLNFSVSVPQILAAIITSAVLEVAITFRQTRSFVWPASAMLTGSGVALILRVVGTSPDEPWSFFGWYIFAGVAGLSLLTKYVIKYRGTHVFNPSNIGLVVAFLVLGPSIVEPLDFWWSPLDLWLIAAYVIIIGGGLLITRRLHLLELAGTFWVTLALGLGILAASGHCMTANWSFTPVCGVDYWRVITTSPEVLIFLFFMITDPKTVPAGRVGRIAFGVLVAVASVLLMAPQTDEWGTKVGLLTGLVVLCAVRPILDRLVPEPKSAADDLRAFGARLVTGNRPSPGVVRVVARTGMLLLAVLLVGVGIVAAGAPSRAVAAADPTEILDGVPHQVDPGTFPPITVDQDVADWDHSIDGAGAQAIALALAENLEVEAWALLHGDASVLPAIAHGDRLAELQAEVEEAASSGETTIHHYTFDSLDLTLIEPFGIQSGLSLGLEASGTVTTETYDADGTLTSTQTEPYERTFVMRRATGDRWLNVGVLPASPTD
jgi:Na+-translocating ferredoxin:NAD+ oxidoreductase RnfD subunit